ncbi:MAG: hypothetical protein HRT35_14520 [Algicola sp.]|nr:hypothetical protein [Algicola sp.]
MKNKIVLAIAAIGFGFSINASADWNPNDECLYAQLNAHQYCDIDINSSLCVYWSRVARGCGDTPMF